MKGFRTLFMTLRSDNDFESTNIADLEDSANDDDNDAVSLFFVLIS